MINCKICLDVISVIRKTKKLRPSKEEFGDQESCIMVYNYKELNQD